MYNELQKNCRLISICISVLRRWKYLTVHVLYLNVDNLYYFIRQMVCRFKIVHDVVFNNYLNNLL